MKKPLFKVKKVTDITIEILRQYYKSVLFIDADNTLFIPKKPLIHQDLTAVTTFFSMLQKAQISSVVISNNFSADKVEYLEKLKIPSVFFAKKPLNIGFRKAQKHVENMRNSKVEKAEILHIGDQFLTDVLGALGYGIDYVLVEPLSPTADLIFTKPSRLVEKLFNIYDE